MRRETPQSNLDLLNAALREGGTREFRGARHNPVVLEWFGDAGASWIDDDETAWCSAFVCAMAEDVGLYNPKTVRARKWLQVSAQYADHIMVPEDLIPGDVVVLWRGSKDGRQGHVGLYLHDDGEHIWLLGGNQGNMVQPKRYPKYQFLGGRRLKPLG